MWQGHSAQPTKQLVIGQAAILLDIYNEYVERIWYESISFEPDLFQYPETQFLPSTF
ncbi:MAG: hypothetical protein Nkreftii_001427 [Candidatus Nitrospira kreftii]|uniref:Uncharacterized protein n=1 Tax=Candidatus Nitrospira kreftii TaxID=2652173 RepID=A0A7S8FD46_9BACT|nr:MAG: hypothetical protein Nkreftii_001427 [Candidatus Nitrospira kreftii]